jgi:hypothetical protein
MAFPLERSIAAFRDFKKVGKEEQAQALLTGMPAVLCSRSHEDT